MPIYEYACGRCAHEFEVEQRISDDPIKTCPKCRSRKVKRLISRTSFVLKGSGWYSDLYSSSKKSEEKTESKGESKPDADAGTKADSKSDAKADSGASKGGKKSGGAKGKSKAA